MRVPVTADERHPVRGHHRGARDGRLCTPSLPPATSTTTTTTRGNPMGRAEKQSQKTYKCGWMGRLHLPSAHFLVRDGGNPLRNSANISTSEANALIRWDLETKKTQWRPNNVVSLQRKRCSFCFGYCFWALSLRGSGVIITRQVHQDSEVFCAGNLTISYVGRLAGTDPETNS